MLNGNQVITLADPHHRWHLAPLCIIFSDLMILILLGGSLVHDYLILGLTSKWIVRFDTLSFLRPSSTWYTWFCKLPLQHTFPISRSSN